LNFEELMSLVLFFLFLFWFLWHFFHLSLDKLQLEFKLELFEVIVEFVELCYW
jgi:hypothetical protein